MTLSRPTPKLALLLLGAIATAVAVAQLAAYQADPGVLWRDVQHDRNSHFSFAMDLAVLMRAGDVISWLDRVSQSVIWPPLNGLLLSAVLLVSGAGRNVAIVSSLAGWVATIVLCGALAGRLARSRPETRVGGAVVAGLFALTSPALRLLGSDVMLESFGAALSAAVLLAWMRCLENPSRIAGWRALGLLLTLLFFDKYNYWALAVAALVISKGHRALGLAVAVIKAASSIPRGRRNWILLGPAAGLALVAAAIAVTGPKSISVFGHQLQLYPTGPMLSIAYAAVLLHFAFWWRRARSALLPAIGPAGLVLLRWHALPIALWLLMPFALPSTIWFLAANAGVQASYAISQNFMVQAMGFSDGFHPAAWAGLLALALAIMGGAWRFREPGAAAIVVFLVLCAFAVVFHPQQQLRFQATWLFSLWALAGAGAARMLPKRGGAILQVSLISVLGVALAQYPITPFAERVAIRSSGGPSDLRLAEAYGPFVADGQPTGFVSTLGKNDFVIWTTRELCRCSVPVDQPFTFNDPSRTAVAATTAAWLTATPSVRVIALDAAPRAENATFGLVADRQRGQLDALMAQTRFRLAETIPVSDDAIVSVWSDSGLPRRSPPHLRLGLGTSLFLAIAILSVLLAPVRTRGKLSPSPTGSAEGPVKP